MRYFLLVLMALIFTLNLWAADETIQLSPATNEYKSAPTKTYNGTNGVARIIPEVSLVASNYTGGISGTDKKLGYSFGLAMDVGDSASQIVAESGIFYRRFGTQLNDLTLDVGYLAIPLLTKIYTNNERGNSAYFKGGVIPGVLVSKEASSNNGGSAKNLPYNDLDLEVALGIGGRFRINDGNDLFLEATYNRGLTNVVDSGSQPNSPVYNAAVLITGGIGFNL